MPNPNLNALLVRVIVGANHHHRGRSVLRGEQASSWNDQRIRNGSRQHGNLHAGTGLEPLLGISCLHPDFNGRAVGIERRADHRNFAFHQFFLTRHSDLCLIANLHQFGFRLRYVRAGNDLGNIHHREQGSARRGHFSWVERTIGDHSVDRAANFRVAQLRFRSQIFALGGLQLPGGGFQRLLFADGLQRFEALVRDLILIAGLG